MQKNSKRILFAVIPLLILAIAGYELVGVALFALSPANPHSADNTVLMIKKGDTPREIAKSLASAGVITSAREFIWVGRLLQQWKKIKTGEYRLSPKMTPMEVLTVLTSGISVNYAITVREGENIYEIAADMEKNKLAPKTRFLALCKDPKFIASLGFKEPLPPSLEGFLFPDTYFFNHVMPVEDMVRQMHRHFKQEWGSAEEKRAAELGMSQFEVITLASMIEKETGAPEERPMISSVFHNRLRKKMKLQSDPTTIYGMWERYDGNIHKQDLLTSTPYNTYTVPALPLGPISNPGKLAITAALNPATSEFLFFVSHNDGTHAFSKTFGEHQNAVKKFQLDPKAREGKSWRDLNKRLAPNSTNQKNVQKQ